MLEIDRQRPRLRPGVAFANPEGTDIYFVYDKESGDRFELNEVAFELVRRMNGECSVAALAVEMEELFEGTANALEDLWDLLRVLQADNLVELLPAT